MDVIQRLEPVVTGALTWRQLAVQLVRIWGCKPGSLFGQG